MTSKKIMIYKSVVILIILSYIVMSCFPCIEKNTSQGCFSGEVTCMTHYSNNISAIMVIALALQIVLLIFNRQYLQMIIGMIGLLPGIILPLWVEILRKLEDVIINMGRHSEYAITPIGWAVTVSSWVLAALTIWLAVVIKKYKKLAVIPTDNNAEERDEVVK